MFVITGISGGIGQQVARQLKLQHPNSRIIGIYNQNCPDMEGVAECFQYNFEDPNGCSIDHYPLFQSILDTDQPINIIHLAGVTVNKTISHVKKDDLDKCFTVNCTSILGMISSLWPKMKADNFGRIILVSSVVPHRPAIGTLGYSISKAALEAAVRVLFTEGSKYNILPFGIALGYTDYGIIQQVPSEMQENLKESIPLHRFGNIYEIMNTINFLLDTPYIAGQIIHLNGGLYLA